MALIRCKTCDEKYAVGCMPTASCGMLLIPAVGATMTVVAAAWVLVGWWSLLVAVPTFFVAIAAVHWIPWTVEYLLTCWRKCPKCGSRHWTFPFTEGFGL